MEPLSRLEAKVERLEEDGRENRRRRDELIQVNDRAHARLHEEINDLNEQVVEIRTKAEERHKAQMKAIGDCASSVARLAAAQETEKQERRQGSTSLRVALITAGAVVLAALIAFLQSVMSGGVH